MDKKEGSTNVVPLALYPHQWLNHGGPYQELIFYSARGPMKILETTGSFSFDLSARGILPALPMVADSSSGYDKAVLSQHIRDAVDQGEGANIFQGNEVYSTAVSIGRTAQMINVADQIGLTGERDTIIQWVKNALENWLSYTAEGDNAWFYYDANYGGLIGQPANLGMFTDSHMNDFHFQVGYMIKAASIIAAFDKQWGRDWGPRVELLIKSAANWERNHETPGSTNGQNDGYFNIKFPFLRHMDPYKGHSWATGAGDFIDGPNQESSSEAMNFASSVALWGIVSGNKTIRDLGMFLYATEAEGSMNYMWDVHNICYPDGKDHGSQEWGIWGDWNTAKYHFPMSGFIFATKCDFATWFGSIIGGEPEYCPGINLLPVTASSFYLGRDQDYVLDFYTFWQDKFNEYETWNEVFWVWLAMADPQLALQKYNTIPHGKDQPHPPSETEAHTYHWIHNMAALGPYRGDITANTDAYAVFGEGDTKTYVAFNPTSSMIAVRFSDGFVMTVPAGQLKQTKESCPIIAHAGADQTVIDKDLNGSETVTLDGSIIAYAWYENGVKIGSGIQAVVDLTLGVHTITLVVTDNDGKISEADTVIITVEEKTSHEFEDSTGNFKAVVVPAVADGVSIAFVPLKDNMGKGFCYVHLTVNGANIGAYPCQPSTGPYQLKNVKPGDQVAFYFNYTLPDGAGMNSDTFNFVVE